MLKAKILIDLIKKIKRVLEKEFEEEIKNKITIFKNVLFIVVLNNFFFI